MNVKGIITGLGSGIFWALDTILLGYVLAMGPFSDMVFLAPFLSTFLHDFFSSIWVAMYLFVTKQSSGVIKALKTKNGWFIVLAALCGGPIGMSGYLFAIQYIGSAYTATISALYPAVGALFGFILLKDKLTNKGVLGLVLAIVSTILIGFTSPDDPTNLLLGFLCALVCVFGWGMECVICAYGMGDEISSDVALGIRQATSWVTYAVVIFPFLGAYSALPDLFSNSNVMLATAGVALAGSASYLCYYKAISMLGPVRAMALNITYSAWAIILGVLVFNQVISLWLLIPCVLIIVGSLLSNMPAKKDIETVMPEMKESVL